MAVFQFSLHSDEAVVTEKPKDLLESSKLSQDQIQSLKEARYNHQISLSELGKWDNIVQFLNKQGTLDDGEVSRLIAYLYNAQMNFAIASKDITGRLSGTLDPISFHIVQLFFPTINPGQFQVANDTFSEQLTAILAKKYDEKFKNEQAKIQPVKVDRSDDQWFGKEPFIGLKIPSMDTWLLDKHTEIVAPKPPSPNDSVFWRDQLSQVRDFMSTATEKQKQRIYFWAKMMTTNSGDWLIIADTYMNAKNVPLEKRLEVRSELASAMLDATIASYTSKYLYLVKRPDMLDPKFKPVIPTPNHPSYPSNHSTTSATAAIILSYYFPENEKEWYKLAEEAGLSRIWAGIHFPLDHESGKDLGAKVGKLYINSNSPAHKK